MKKFIINSFLFASLGIIACNSSSTETTTNNDTTTTQPELTTPLKNCYSAISNTDTSLLEITINANNNVTGNLQYKLSGKDKNTGTIKGLLKNDTLIADYIFMSEGKESKRQVVFLKTGTMLTEGYGSIEEVNGAMQFKKEAPLDFSKGTKFVLVDCKN